MVYIKLKSGREIRGWKAALIAAPFVIVFSPVLLLFAIIMLPIWLTYASVMFIVSRIERG